MIPEGRINGCKGPGLGHSCRKTRKEKITAMGRTQRAERGSRMTVHCLWEVQMARTRTGHPL